MYMEHVPVVGIHEYDWSFETRSIGWQKPITVSRGPNASLDVVDLEHGAGEVADGDHHLAPVAEFDLACLMIKRQMLLCN